MFCTAHSHSAYSPALVMVAPSFPLLRLPLDNLKDVFRNMKITELTCCSLLSTRTKHFIRQFCIFESIHIYVEVDHALKYRIYSHGYLLHSCFLKNGEFSIKNSYQKEIKWQVDPSSWLNNLMYIVNPAEIYNLCFEPAGRTLDMQLFQMVKDSLKRIPIVNLSIDYFTKTDHITELLTTFPPINNFKFWHYSSNPLKPSQLTELRPVLSQRFCELSLISDLSLDELLLIRGPFIDITSHILTDKDVNVFLKHWMAGLKPELKYLCLRNDRTDCVFHPTAILEGIPHELAPIERKFCMHDVGLKFGGIDIHQAQGIEATMVFFNTFTSGICVAVHNSEYISFR